jgi:nucleotide-binding universal stress UspA family protein
MAEIKNILCAIDFSESSPQVAEYAMSMARGLGAGIVFLYVAPTLRRYAAYQIETVSIDNFVGLIVAGAQEEMDRFLEKIAAGHQRVSGKVALGYAPEVIIQTALEEKADLVVMGTHGRKGIDTILFGSVAEKVLKKSPLPVLTIRPDRK